MALLLFKEIKCQQPAIKFYLRVLISDFFFPTVLIFSSSTVSDKTEVLLNSKTIAS
jgi:hypothetical protein